MSRTNRTPPALGWLVGKHARVANDVAELHELHERLCHRLALTEARLVGLKERIAHTHASLDCKATELDALGKAVKQYSAMLEPERIEPVQDRAGRYGQWGALSGAIMRILGGLAPEAATAPELMGMVQAEFGLTDWTRQESYRWYQNTFKPALRQLAEAGRIRRADGTRGVYRSTLWTAQPQPGPTLAQIRAHAASVQSKDKTNA